MLFDAVPYEDYAARTHDQRLMRAQAIIRFLEKKLGVAVIYPERSGLEKPEFREISLLAQALSEGNIIRSIKPGPSLPDEPRFKSWIAASSETEDLMSGGSAAEDDGAALRAALAESLERHLWLNERDYFLRPVRARVDEISRYGVHIPPERFVSFSDEFRSGNDALRLKSDAAYLWIQATSLVSGAPVYIPAQTASRAINPAEYPVEPIIRHQNTNGLATWPTRVGAQLAGMLELIEREAYMVMWLNQLTVPRISSDSFGGKNPALDRLIARCTRYRLKVHVLSLPTDAPTHAIGVVIEDESGSAPRFSLGLKAHPSLSHAVEKALLEALRARRVSRMYFMRGGTWDPHKPVEEISRGERLYYWSDPQNAEGLSFLIAGEEHFVPAAVWEHDAIEEHFQRIVQWCSANRFECVSVAMGHSTANPTPWEVEMVVMPDLQPTYLVERLRELGGTRRVKLAEKLGYAARKEPFADAPHPYS